MSEEERIWADTLADAVEPANEYARRIRRKYMVSDRNDRYGICLLYTSPSPRD